ncbi:hypothetical protein KJ819_00280 [Patescibacteria group bacterium]|nr:hypothetical protein [Patescibacteria group bacterium]MBU1500636.1 hypothetical protein [Patescibacteria group bacterium]MBU2080521.1 hypothetical protein [Patescibacteria group bacterium]MBU2123674.1 hypothetical protein [Patescibacteria group bacterium]MBU2194530.1 hypothetical protein [Patescibacteria group bacterium]
MATTDPKDQQPTSSVDKSQFIRTMAKDMAQAGNTPSSPQTKEPTPKVVLPEPGESFWSKPMPKEVPQETVELPTIEEAAAITEAKPVTPEEPAPPVQTDVEREEVLARLRKKVSENAEMNVQKYPAPAPLPSEAKSEWPDIPAPTPAFAPLAEPTPERIPPVTKEQVPEASPKAVENIHTFKSDFADRIDTKQANTFSVLAAQQDAAPLPVPKALAPEKTGKRMVVVIASGVLLLMLAGGGIYATYHFVMTARNTPVAALVVPSIVFADEYKQLSGSGPELMSALAETANSTLVPGNVLVTYVRESAVNTEGETETRPASGSVFIRALELGAPDILLRNIGGESTVGVVHAGSETRAFFALRVDSYERTYAGMLTWEPLLQKELSLLYPLYPVEIGAAAPVATTTASSTPTTATSTATVIEQGIPLTRFSDAIIANYDVRVLKDTNGKTLVLYGYVNKQTLIIARDEAAFQILLERLKPAS